MVRFLTLVLGYITAVVDDGTELSRTPSLQNVYRCVGGHGKANNDGS